MLIIPLLAGLLTLVLLLPALSWFHKSDDGWRFLPTLVIAGASLTLVRLSSYWYLLHLEATRQQTYVTALLGIALFREAMVATP
jgi:hypothetical protein